MAEQKAAAVVVDPKSYTHLLLAVDIESGSDDLFKAPVAIGFALMDPTGKTEKHHGIVQQTLFRRRLNWDGTTSQKPEGFSDRCWEEYWLNLVQKPEFVKNLAMLKDWHGRGGSTEDMARDVVKCLDEIEERYCNAKIEIVSDNPVFDVARIDYLIRKWGGRQYGIRYTRNGKYRWVSDPSEQREMLSDEQQKAIKLVAGIYAPHDHNPVNDAINIGAQLIEFRKFKALHEVVPKNKRKAEEELVKEGDTKKHG